MTDIGKARRNAIGIRLIVVSLVLAVMSGIVLEVVPIILTASAIDASAYVIHTFILPSLEIGLLAAFALVGFAGIFLIEWERSRHSVGARHVWDRARIAIATAALAAMVWFSSGIMLGLVYLPAHAGWTAMRLGSVFVAALGVGLYLLWTAERLAPGMSKSVGRVALAFGIGSNAIGVGTAALVAFNLSDLGYAPTGLGLLWLAGFLAGLLSLLAWIIVFSRLSGAHSDGGRFRATVGSLTL